jgi:hypothetical protein
MLRKFMFSGVMMSAVVIPYAMSTGSSWWETIKTKAGSFSQPSAESTESKPLETGPPPAFQSGTPTHYAHVSPAPGMPARAIPIEGYGTHNLGEVINFGATPSWVMTRWPRVTVGLAELDMQGYRVPLVTGTGADDLAGSLTYYFDTDQHVKLIHFRGTTGDPRKLVQLVMSQYKLVPQQTGNPSLQLYQYKWMGKPVSELQVHTAHVLRASDPFKRFQLELALKRP